MDKDFWFDRHDRIVNRLAFIFIAVISILFLISIYRFSFNGPYAYDDFNLFVVTFSDRFLGANSFVDKVKYLFSPNNYPHTKFFGRFFSMLHYLATGTVNFKFLIMIGAIIVTAFTFIARRTTKFDLVLLVPLVLMLLLPERMNFWVGTASGYPILLCCGLLIFYWLSIGKFVAPVILAFFTAFAQNPGLAVFIAAFPLFLIAPNKSWGKRVVWLAVFAISLFMFWAMVISKGSELGNNSGVNLTKLPQCFPSMLAYEGQFLSMPFFGGSEIKHVIRRTPVLGIMISIIIFAVLSSMVWRQKKSFTPKNAMLLAFLLFCLSGAGFAALLTDDCTVMTDNVSPRYMIWSVMAWIGIYLFLLQSSSRKFQLMIALAFAVMFLPRFVSEYANAAQKFQERQYTWAQMGTMTNVPPNRARFNFSELEHAIETGLYIPAFKRGEKSGFPLPEKLEQIKAVWYDHVKNEYFCKTEAFIGVKDDPIVEFWIGDGGNLRRLIPQETDPKMSRRFLKDGSRSLKENPPISKYSKSYIYISDNLEDCKRIRIRRGNGVSDYLVSR